MLEEGETRFTSEEGFRRRLRLAAYVPLAGMLLFAVLGVLVDLLVGGGRADQDGQRVGPAGEVFPGHDPVAGRVDEVDDLLYFGRGRHLFADPLDRLRGVQPGSGQQAKTGLQRLDGGLIEGPPFQPHPAIRCRTAGSWAMIEIGTS